MNPIVLATDGSPSAADATKQAVELARATGAKLFVVSVWHAGLAVYSTAALPESKRVAKEQACEAARSAVEVARAAGIEAESFVLEGDAVGRICGSAADTNAALLVVGSHGFGPVRPARLRQRLDGAAAPRALPRARRPATRRSGLRTCFGMNTR